MILNGLMMALNQSRHRPPRTLRLGEGDGSRGWKGPIW